MKTADEMKQAAAKQRITRWNIHNCSICGAPVGFNIWGDYVEFDGACDCAWGDGRPTDWNEVADCYNLNAGAPDVEERMAKYPEFKAYVEETNKLWGFNAEKEGA